MANTKNGQWIIRIVVIAMWGVIVALTSITYANLTSDIGTLCTKVEKLDARLDTINNEVRIGTQWITVLQDKINDQESRIRELEHWMARWNREP